MAGRGGVGGWEHARRTDARAVRRRPLASRSNEWRARCCCRRREQSEAYMRRMPAIQRPAHMSKPRRFSRAQNRLDALRARRRAVATTCQMRRERRVPREVTATTARRLLRTSISPTARRAFILFAHLASAERRARRMSELVTRRAIASVSCSMALERASATALAIEVP